MRNKVFKRIEKKSLIFGQNESKIPYPTWSKKWTILGITHMYRFWTTLSEIKIKSSIFV